MHVSASANSMRRSKPGTWHRQHAMPMMARQPGRSSKRGRTTSTKDSLSCTWRRCDPMRQLRNCMWTEETIQAFIAAHPIDTAGAIRPYTIQQIAGDDGDEWIEVILP